MDSAFFLFRFSFFWGRQKDIIIKRSGGESFSCFFFCRKSFFSFLFHWAATLCCVSRARGIFSGSSLDSCNPAGRFRLTRSRNRKRVSLRQQQWVQLVIHPGEEKGEMHRQIDRRLIRLAWHRRE